MICTMPGCLYAIPFLFLIQVAIETNSFLNTASVYAVVCNAENEITWSVYGIGGHGIPYIHVFACMHACAAIQSILLENQICVTLKAYDKGTFLWKYRNKNENGISQFFKI